MITIQQKRGALQMRALREVQAQFPREEYDRAFDLAQGATALVLAAAKQATGAPDPSAYGIDAEALAKEFAKKYGLPIERATRVVQVLVSEISVEAYFQEAADYLKKQRGEGDAAEVGDGGGDAPLNSTTASRRLDSLSLVQVMRRITGDASWGADLLGAPASSAAQRTQQAPAQSPKVLDLRAFAGRNATERAMSAVREQSHGRRWSFDELHEAGCELIRLARAGGAEVLS